VRDQRMLDRAGRIDEKFPRCAIKPLRGRIEPTVGIDSCHLFSSMEITLKTPMQLPQADRRTIR
jgi:hypothetical protein